MMACRQVQFLQSVMNLCMRHFIQMKVMTYTLFQKRMVVMHLHQITKSIKTISRGIQIISSLKLAL